MAKFEDEGDYKTEIEVTVKEEVWQCDVCGSDNAWGAVKCEACGNQHCTDSVSSKVESPDMVTSSVLLESSQTATSTGEIDGNNKPQRRALRTDFTSCQKEAIDALFGRGVQRLKTPSDKADIEATAASAGLPVKKVVQALYTRASKRRRPAEPPKPKYCKRKLHAYDIYKKDHIAGNLNKEGMQTLAQGWKNVKERGQVLEYQCRAEEENNARSQNQDKGVIKRHLQKQLGALVQELQEIGVETVLMMVGTELETAGSTKGEAFLQQHSDVEHRWFAHCVGANTVEFDNSIEASGQRVRKLLNKKYTKRRRFTETETERPSTVGVELGNPVRPTSTAARSATSAAAPSTTTADSSAEALNPNLPLIASQDNTDMEY